MYVTEKRVSQPFWKKLQNSLHAPTTLSHQIDRLTIEKVIFDVRFTKMPIPQYQKNLLDQTWLTVRPQIGKELLAESEIVPVPNLSQAEHFGLFSVFVKCKSVSFKCPKLVTITISS